jgi:serine protease AprX
MRRDDPVGSEFFTPQVFGWHGTMTACCAAGSGYVSGGRYRGLASEADVVLIKAGVDGGRVVGKHVAHAIRFPLRHPHLEIRILNISLGVRSSDPDRDDVEAAVQEVVARGITVFAAAGNIAGIMPMAPASATEAITVGGGHVRGHQARQASRGRRLRRSPRPGVTSRPAGASIWVRADAAGLPGGRAMALFRSIGARRLGGRKPER